MAGDIDLPRFSDGEAILHLDLHPDNVMITAAGPMEGTTIDDDARRWIRRVCDQRLLDPNARDDEKARVRSFAAHHTNR